MIELSVIIPTYNRKASLRNCLESLAGQTQSISDYEVVVVVDGSADGTQEMLRSYQSPYHLQVLQQPNSGQCKALNQGALAATGKIFLFIDDDMIASPQLVAKHLEFHRQHPHSIGIGKTTLTLPPDADWFARGFADEWEQHFNDLDQEARKLTWLDCFGSNTSISKVDYHQVGGNLEGIARAYDIELAYRLENIGCSIAYIPDAIAVQVQGKGYRELINDAEKSGQACVELSKIHPEMFYPMLGTFPEQRPFMQTMLRLMLATNIAAQRYWYLFRILGKQAYKKQKFQLLHRYAYWRSVKRTLSKSDWHALIYGTPILMYHAIGFWKDKPGRYITPLKKFRKQLAWLKLAGYKVISLEDYVNIRSSNEVPPPKSVIITFDDGYADNFTLGLPILKQYKYPAIIFLVTGAIGHTNTWDQASELTNRPILTWDQIHRMQEAGILFGAHSHNHLDLTTISEENVEKELSSTRSVLENALDHRIVFFSYPYGLYNGFIISLLQKIGFQASCTTQIGKNSLVVPMHKLRRVEIRGTDSIFQFILSVRYGLDSQNLKRIFS